MSVLLLNENTNSVEIDKNKKDKEENHVEIMGTRTVGGTAVDWAQKRTLEPTEAKQRERPRSLLYENFFWLRFMLRACGVFHGDLEDEQSR